MLWSWLKKALTPTCKECLVHEATHDSMCEDCYTDWRDEKLLQDD